MYCTFVATSHIVIFFYIVTIGSIFFCSWKSNPFTWPTYSCKISKCFVESNPFAWRHDTATESAILRIVSIEDIVGISMLATFIVKNQIWKWADQLHGLTTHLGLEESKNTYPADSAPPCSGSELFLTVLMSNTGLWMLYQTWWRQDLRLPKHEGEDIARSGLSGN